MAGLFDRISPDPRELPPDDASDISLDHRKALIRGSPRANAYLSLEPGLRWYGDQDGLITWAGWRQTAFAVGGLHGPQAVEVYKEFRRAARAAGYDRVLVFPVAEAERKALAEARFPSLMIGSEASLDPTEFSLVGGARADLRQMVNRGRKRHGLVVEEVPGSQVLSGLSGLYEGWLASRPQGYRMRLLIGSPGFAEPLDRRYFQVRDPDGRPRAFVSITPGWSGQGYGLDVMARPPQAPPGSMETLLCGVLERLAAEGIDHFSLGACPMNVEASRFGGDDGSYRALFRWLHDSSVGNRLFAFRGLTHFKAKFVPRWEPVFLAAWPRVGFRTLYAGCRMWGLFGAPPQGPVGGTGLSRGPVPR